MNATQSDLRKIKDKQIFLYSEYLIFFDDVCMNKYVTSYSTNIGVSVGMGTATVSLLYTPAFADMPSIDTVNQTVENGICMRIFASNPFTRKFVSIFDGIIKQKVVNRSAGDATVSFTAVDYIYWMQRIVAPIAIPLHDAIAPGERLKWKAQSVDPATTAKAETTEAGRLKGKKVQEFFDILKSKTFENSKTYSDPNTVANFDAAADRVEIMGDISEELVKHEVIDFVVDTNATFADTMFVTMNNVTSNLLLEFYQDRDGIIRLKPPFWNEGVLRSHVIDPLMIVNAQEQTNWLNFYTRVIMTGGTEEWAQNDSKVDFLTPVGVYVGNLSDKSRARWTDYTSEGDTGSSYGGYIPKNGSSGGGAGGSGGGNSTIVETARKYLGVPYVYGGTSPSGFDCSGLVQYVFKECGYDLPRVADDQIQQGEAISWENLQPGDLVGFASSPGGTYASHIGIYSGNYMMIHAPHTGDVVKEASIESSYYQSRFITGRRIS